MQAWEEKILEKQKAHAEGLTEGLAKGHAEGLAKGHDQLLMNQIQKKLEKGYSPEKIADALETDLSIIQQFIEQLTDHP